MSDYSTILVSTRGRVGWITLNRPEALNALNSTLVEELAAAAAAFDADEEIGCIVVTGSERAFAAGADIKQMEDRSAVEMSLRNPFVGLEAFSRVRTPVIAAVAGYALGGGCELAMACDIILAADTARFGQPEITRRHPRPRRHAASAACDRLLQGGRARAHRTDDGCRRSRAGRPGLPRRARRRPARRGRSDGRADRRESLPVLYAAKESLRASLETGAAEGLRFEKQVFTSLFALDDQKEGMAAFREKRAPRFTNR
jgi:enoyl-CoA hydratase